MSGVIYVAFEGRGRMGGVGSERLSNFPSRRDTACSGIFLDVYNSRIRKYRTEPSRDAY